MNYKITSFGSFGLLTVAAVFGAEKQTSSRPNILLVVVDDMGYSDPGCFGSEISTPTINRLADTGIRYTNFYNTGRSWPTRSSIMTGYYFPAVRQSTAKNRQQGWSRTIAQMLAPHGYHTYHSGKWHVNPIPKAHADGGFEYSMTLGSSNSHYDVRANSVNDKKVEYPGSEPFSSTVISEYMIEALETHQNSHKGEPFFAYLAYTAPHFPLQVDQKYIDKYKKTYLQGWDKLRKKRYERMKSSGIVDYPMGALEPQARWVHQPQQSLGDSIGAGEVFEALPWDRLTPEQRDFQATKMAIHAGMVEQMDQQLGRVVAQLEKMGELDNTVIFFLSDNGASAEMMIRGKGHDSEARMGSEHSFLCLGGGWAHLANAPLRRSKIWVHEGGVSTPLIVSWGNGIRARNELRHTQGHVVDIVPTILELAGKIELQKDISSDYPALHGKSLVPSFVDDKAVRHDFIYFNHQKNYALIQGEWKLVAAEVDGHRWQLYNIAADRAETTDLALKYPDRVAQMEKKWNELTESYKKQSTHPTSSQNADRTTWNDPVQVKKKKK